MYKDLTERTLRDAALLKSYLKPEVKLRPLPIKLDGLPTIAMTIVVEVAERAILHPIAIVPHDAMIIQDNRFHPPHIIQHEAVTVHPRDMVQRRQMESALHNPEAFFRNWNN